MQTHAGRALGEMRPILGCCSYKTQNIKRGQHREPQDGFSSTASEGTQPNLPASGMLREDLLFLNPHGL